MRYKAYKNTEISWANRIPEHWQTKRIASIFELRKEKNDPVKTTEVLSLSAKHGVTPYSKRKEKGGNKPKADMTKYNVCHKGDILVNSMNVVAGSVGISEYYGAISPVYYALSTDTKENNNYFMEYIFRNYDFQRSMVGLGKGIMMNESEEGVLTTVRMRISWDTLKTLLVPVPPKEEQEQIAKFLDWKINEIDRLIEIKKEKLSAMESMKQLKIDKEYEKLSSAPLIKVKHLGDFLKTGNLSRNDEDESSDKKALLYGDIYTSYDYSFSNCVTTISEEAYGNAPKINKDTLFFTTSGELREEIGKCIVYVGNDKIAVGGDMVVLKPKKEINAEYLMLALNTSKAINYRYIHARGDIIIHISQGKLANYHINLPSKDEQDAFVSEIYKSTTRNKKLQENLKEQIEFFKVFKHSLISEVVTGKIDVRNIEIPTYEKVETNIDEDFEDDDAEIEEEV